MAARAAGTLLLLAGTAVAQDTCSGKIQVLGHGEVYVTRAQWERPGAPGGAVDVVESAEVRPHLAGRAYFADGCASGAYDNRWYSVLRLLGSKLRYTVDLSGASCGCRAAVRLVPMFENMGRSACADHYCDAAASCGESCTEIEIQDADTYSWRTSLHAITSSQLPPSSLLNSTSTYGPGGSIINTRLPFQVSIAFPLDSQDRLEAVEVELSQSGLSLIRTVAGPAAAMSEILAALEAGVTPAVSYSRQPRRGEWGAPCAGAPPGEEEVPCASTVTFYNFVIEPLPYRLPAAATAAQGAPPTGSAPAPAAGPLGAAAAAASAAAEAVAWSGTSVGGRVVHAAADGWAPPPACESVFAFRGELFQGCVAEGSEQPWCSHDALYTAGLSGWSLCAPGAMTAPPAPAPASGEEVAEDYPSPPALGGQHQAPPCAVEDIAYLPLDMYGQHPRWGGDAAVCQMQCADLPGCAYWTFLISDTSCHFADRSASRRPGGSGSLAGPAHCEDEEAMVMRRYSEPAAGYIAVGRQPLGTAASASAATALALAGLLALTRPFLRPPAQARSISLSDLLSAEEQEGDEARVSLRAQESP